MRTFSLVPLMVLMSSLFSFSQVGFAQVATVAMPSPAPSALAMPDNIGAALSLLGQVMPNVQSKQWPMAVASLIMLLVYAARMWLFPKFNVTNTSWLPWASAVAGVLVAVAVNLSVGESWATALVSGLTMGTAASGLWGLVGGKMPATPDQKAAAAAANSAPQPPLPPAA